MTSRRLQIIHLFILFALILFTYANSLHNPFMMDDYELILQDTKLHNLKFILYQFIPDQKIFLGIENKTNSTYYRPFAHIIPMIEWLLFGKDVFGYHLMNLLLFYICVSTIFYLIKDLFHNNIPLAMLTSILYAIHPLNGLFINYITANVYAVQMTALCIAFILFWKATQQKHPFYLVVYSFFLYIIGLLCHESSFAFPLYLTATLLILKEGLRKRDIFLLSPYFAISIIYFLFRLKFASLNHNLFDKIKYSNISLIQLTVSNIKLFFCYIYKFIFFEGITLKFAVQPVAFNKYIIWIISFSMLMAILIYWYYKKDKLQIWSLSILLIGFIPVFFGSVFELQCGIILEPHWLFFASIGLFALASFYILKIKETAGELIFLIILCIILSNTISYSKTMNKLWANEIAYCKYWLKHSPKYKSVLFYIASAYERRGEYNKAKKTYINGIEARFSDWQIYTNLALIEQHAGNLRMAYQYLMQAYRIFPNSAIINNNLGILFKKSNKIKQSEIFFKKAIKYNPYMTEPYLNLAILYEEKQKYLQALELYKKTTLIDPNNEPGIIGEVKLLISLHKDDQLTKRIQQLINKPYSTDLYLNIAVYLTENGYRKTALRLFRKALVQDPKNINIYIKLGKYFANMNKFDIALKIWNTGLKLYPKNKTIKMLIKKTKKIQNSIIHMPRAQQIKKHTKN